MAKKKRSGIAWIAVAVAAIILAAIALGWVLGSRGGEEDPPAATQGTSGGPSTSTQAEGETDGICGLPVGSQKVPVAGPEATWELKAGVTVPSSKEYGPGIVKDDDRACFAHNPMGAVFFALNLPAIAPQNWADHIEGPVPDTTGTGSPPGNTTLTVRGFKVQSPTPDRAVVTIAYAVSGQPGYQVGSSAYEWVDGDWKWVAEDPVNTTDQFNTTTSLDGYTPWGPK